MNNKDKDMDKFLKDKFNKVLSKEDLLYAKTVLIPDSIDKLHLLANGYRTKAQIIDNLASEIGASSVEKALFNLMIVSDMIKEGKF